VIILGINTSTEITELYLINDNHIIDETKWNSGRDLAKDLLSKIKLLLEKNNLSYEQVDAYIGYLGPGSFTGLRIGISAINSLAYTNNKPIVGSAGDEWINKALDRLLLNQDDKVLVPEYGSEANITLPKK